MKRAVLLILSIMFLWGAVLIGCAPKEYLPLPEGERTQASLGYLIYCKENPDSIFCKEVLSE
ncbi:MAG: hypothetical protein RBR67_17525 [Desulfobacterium sp.]|jgi:hypothetical protein|nr:hypothetical protein [Desulfobacterium sp.]